MPFENYSLSKECQDHFFQGSFFWGPFCGIRLKYIKKNSGINFPEKWSLGKIVPRENALRKLFPVKRMLGPFFLGTIFPRAIFRDSSKIYKKKIPELILRKNGPQKNGPQEKLFRVKMPFENYSLSKECQGHFFQGRFFQGPFFRDSSKIYKKKISGINFPEKWSTRKMIPGKMDSNFWDIYL